MLVLIVVAADDGVHVLAGAVVAVVVADDVAAAGAGDVDAVAVAKHLHGVVDFVVLDEVLAGVEVGLALLPRTSLAIILRASRASGWCASTRRGRAECG